MACAWWFVLAGFISVPACCTLQAEFTPVLQPFLSWGAIFTNPKALRESLVLFALLAALLLAS